MAYIRGSTVLPPKLRLYRINLKKVTRMLRAFQSGAQREVLDEDDHGTEEGLEQNREAGRQASTGQRRQSLPEHPSSTGRPCQSGRPPHTGPHIAE